jgi:hypothetical protein
MNLTIKMNQYNKDYVILSDKIKNNIMNNGDFFRIFFSNELFTSNGIFINFNLENILIEKYFNKIKCNFVETPANINIINEIKKLERDLLEKFDYINIKPIYRVDEQLSNQYIKLFDDKNFTLGKYVNLKFLLKISGIWSSNNDYGLTFRFFIIGMANKPY